MKPPYSKSHWLRQQEIEARNATIRRVAIGTIVGVFVAALVAVPVIIIWSGS